MGYRHITRTYRRRIIRTDKEGLINLLERLRSLEDEHREGQLRQRTEYKRQTLEKLTRELNSSNEFTRRYAQENIKAAQAAYEELVASETANLAMSATFTVSSSVSEFSSGSAREIVEFGNFNKSQSVKIHVSGNYSGPISVKISRDSGIVVTLSSSDMELYDKASVTIPAWLNR